MGLEHGGMWPEEPLRMGARLVKSMRLDEWREAAKVDDETNRWSNIFDKIEPNYEAISFVTGRLMMATGGTISPHFLFAQVQAVWTYGFAKACSMLADEDITLWEDKPFDFPYDNIVPEPEPPAPSSQALTIPLAKDSEVSVRDADAPPIQEESYENCCAS